jgi:hypothetical protein
MVFAVKRGLIKRRNESRGWLLRINAGRRQMPVSFLQCLEKAVRGFSLEAHHFFLALPAFGLLERCSGSRLVL